MKDDILVVDMADNSIMWGATFNARQDNKILIKAYLHEYSDNSYSIVFASKELGWMEFVDEDEIPLFHYPTKKKLITSMYSQRRDPVEAFKRFSKLTYLGIL